MKLHLSLLIFVVQFVIAKGSSQQNIGLKFSEVDNVLKLKNWYMKGDTHEVL